MHTHILYNAILSLVDGIFNIAITFYDTCKTYVATYITTPTTQCMINTSSHHISVCFKMETEKHRSLCFVCYI